MNRRGSNLPEGNYPLVSVQRFQSLKCDVNTRQLDELAKYISYVESASGDKPTEGEVVVQSGAAARRAPCGPWPRSCGRPGARRQYRQPPSMRPPLAPAGW